MQTEYSLKLRCATCGCDDKFEFNEDKSYVKLEELKELNTDTIDEVKEQIKRNAAKYVQDEFKKAFKGNKFVKFK